MADAAAMMRSSGAASHRVAEGQAAQMEAGQAAPEPHPGRAIAVGALRGSRRGGDRPSQSRAPNTWAPRREAPTGSERGHPSPRAVTAGHRAWDRLVDRREQQRPRGSKEHHDRPGMMAARSRAWLRDRPNHRHERAPSRPACRRDVDRGAAV